MSPRNQNKTFVHVPFRRIIEKLPLIVELKLNVEVYFSAHDLDHLSGQDLERLNQTLVAEGLECTIHGPFMDLSPGGVDPKVRAITLERFAQAVELAEILRPQLMVFHPGYDEFRFGESKEQWLVDSLKTWEYMLRLAEDFDLRLALENVFDPTPTLLLKILRHFSSPRLGHCFDIGHYALFSRQPLRVWLEELGPYLVSTHLHDNRGQVDEHLALGEGRIDLPDFFRGIHTQGLAPLLIIEAHTEDAARLSLERLPRYLDRVIHKPHE